jgi:hypothetical protein
MEAVIAVWLYGLLWPVAIPSVAGWVLGGIVGKLSLSKSERTSGRHQRELEEAKHRVEVAKLLEEENRILDQRIRENARTSA